MGRMVALLCSGLGSAADGADPSAEAALVEPRLRNLHDIPSDLVPPVVTDEAAAAGRRVRVQLSEFAGTPLHHVLYLPINWRPDRSYPVIVEYPGNGGFENKLGDRCSGRQEDCRLGYGISAGRDFIWVCPPFVDKASTTHSLRWWGDADATTDYCRQCVRQTCADYGGDPDKVLLAGFSRGAIACNYIGLRNDDIAALWRGMIVHSHYDGVRQWGYPEDDRAAATRRLKRLGDRPQFISHEVSIDAVRDYLRDTTVDATFLPIPYPNHSDAWVLKDIPERTKLREWVAQALSEN
ncbi:MAG: hypothetical protein R3B90_17245 [Planctomycetaceae bacterium]